MGQGWPGKAMPLPWLPNWSLKAAMHITFKHVRAHFCPYLPHWPPNFESLDLLLKVIRCYITKKINIIILDYEPSNVAIHI